MCRGTGSSGVQILAKDQCGLAIVLVRCLGRGPRARLKRASVCLAVGGMAYLPVAPGAEPHGLAQFFELGRLQLAPFSGLEVPQFQRTNPDSFEPLDT